MESFEIVPAGSHPKGLSPAEFKSEPKFRVGEKRAVRVNARVACAGEITEENGFLLRNKDTGNYYLLVPYPTGDVTIPIWSSDDGEQMETCVILQVM